MPGLLRAKQQLGASDLDRRSRAHAWRSGNAGQLAAGSILHTAPWDVQNKAWNTDTGGGLQGCTCTDSIPCSEPSVEGEAHMLDYGMPCNKQQLETQAGHPPLLTGR